MILRSSVAGVRAGHGSLLSWCSRLCVCRPANNSQEKEGKYRRGMSWCCRKRSGMGPSLQDQLREKLSGVELCYPGTNYACLLDLEGKFLSGFFVDGDAPQRDEVCAAVAALKRAAEQFAATLGQLDCPVLHISGESHLFSCYDLGESVLAFYSHMGSENVRSFNTHDADVRLRDLLADIKLLLTGAVLLSPGSNPSPPVAASDRRSMV